jgi:hypothetical protein
MHLIDLHVNHVILLRNAFTDKSYQSLEAKGRKSLTLYAELWKRFNQTAWPIIECASQGLYTSVEEIRISSYRLTPINIFEKCARRPIGVQHIIYMPPGPATVQPPSLVDLKLSTKYSQRNWTVADPSGRWCGALLWGAYKAFILVFLEDGDWVC